MQVVWLKRDLRLSDHEPLRLALEQARAAGPVLLCYFHEPSLLSRPDTAAQHVGFVQETLDELQQELRRRGSDLLVLTAEAVEALSHLHTLAPVRHLWAHAETTHQAGFDRDKRVHRWARAAKVRFHELAQNAVVRGSARETQRFEFSSHVKAAISEPLWSLPLHGPRARRVPGLMPREQVQALSEQLSRHSEGQWFRSPLQYLVEPAWPGFSEEGPLPQLGSTEDKVLRLSGGRKAAQEQLERFLAPSNLLVYPSAISSPLSALGRCSRLSPYLAWGVISDREVLQALARAVTEHGDLMSAARAKELKEAGQFFIERLYWRSAYLQSAEDRPQVETEPGLPQFRGLRASERMQGWLQAWAAGQTGFPLVDAAMRMLNATGWLNMRLRGTVTSFAVNDLWLPWEDVGQVLAREFLDYEPAIHWNQLQIHAGEARYATPLTYDVVKQARDHDPGGAFVRQWVPELRGLPTEHLFEPWLAPAAVQAQAGCFIGRDYPAPLVRYPAANEAARTRVAALREGKALPPSAFWRMRTKELALQGQASLF